MSTTMDAAEQSRIAQQFKTQRVLHPFQQEVKSKLLFISECCQDISIVVLTGATGVGKSAALQMFSTEFLKAREKQLAESASLRPIVYSVASANGHKRFDLKLLYKSTLRALDDPFVASREIRNQAKPAAAPRFLESPSATLLRDHLEITLKRYDTRVWIIDEAQHIIRGGASGGPGDQYDIIKSLAQTTGALIILCGPFDLPIGMANSGQLSRRSQVICLHRYRWLTPKERQLFGSAIHTVLSSIPGSMRGPDIKSNLKHFYVHTLGCVGIFKDWATRALSLAIQEQRRDILLDDFNKTKLTPRQLATINTEILMGELEYSAGEEPDKDLKTAILNATPQHPQSPPIESSPGKSRSSGRTRSVKTLKPGERKSVHDPVGIAGV